MLQLPGIRLGCRPRSPIRSAGRNIKRSQITACHQRAINQSQTCHSSFSSLLSFQAYITNRFKAQNLHLFGDLGWQWNFHIKLLNSSTSESWSFLSSRAPVDKEFEISMSWEYPAKITRGALFVWELVNIIPNILKSHMNLVQWLL